MKRPVFRQAFTLLELLIVIGIIALLAIVVVLLLNPGEMVAEARDSDRSSDMSTLSRAISIYQEDQIGGSIGVASTTYISVPDPAATTTAGTNCASMGLPPLPNGLVYHCAASSTYRNVDGTGWIPVNFSTVTISPPLNSLPVDPVNTTSSNLLYTYTVGSSPSAGTGYAIAANPESSKLQNSLRAQGVSLIVAGSAPSLAPVLSSGSFNNPMPTLTSISPTSQQVCTVGCSGNFTLTVSGTGFVSSSVIYASGTYIGVIAFTTTYISSSSLTGITPKIPFLNSVPETDAITVTNPAPGGGTSGVQNFTETGGF
jgi:prepilin-type N-terminal cleavage/methylation domain-containing protein